MFCHHLLNLWIKHSEQHLLDCGNLVTLSKFMNIVVESWLIKKLIYK